MAKYRKTNPRIANPPKVNAHPAAPQPTTHAQSVGAPSPTQVWNKNPGGISTRDMAQYQGRVTGDSMQFLSSQKAAMEKVAKNKAERKFLEKFFTRNKTSQNMVMSGWYGEFAPALQSGEGWTQAQRKAFDKWSAITKTNLEQEAIATGKNKKSIDTSITRPQEYKDFANARLEWNRRVEQLAILEHPSDGKEQLKFIDKYANSAEHGLVKARKAGLWTHLWDNMDSTQVLNLLKNRQRGASTDLRNVIGGLLRKQVMENRGISRTAEQAVRDKEFIDISRKYGVESGSKLDDALKYMDDVPVYDAPTVSGGVLDYQVLDHGGSFSQINDASNYDNPYRYNMERTPIAGVLGSSSDTNLETVITDPARVTGGQDFVSGHPTRNLHPSAELGEYLPGGSRSIQGTSQELLDRAVKLGNGKITHRSLIDSMMQMGSPDLVKEIQAYGLHRQVGASNIKALAGLTVAAGITLAALPLVSEANRDAYIEAAIKTGKAGMDVMNWWDKNSSGKYKTTANQLIESIGLGDVSRSVKEYEDRVEESVNEAVPYLGTVGRFATDLIGDVVNEIPGLVISAAEAPQNLWNYFQPKDEAKHNPHGLLVNRWTNG